MKIRRSLKYALVSCSLLAMFGCGDGGGGGGGTLPVTPGTPETPQTPGTTATAALKLSTQGALPAGTVIGGIDVTVNLRSGTSCKSDSDGTTQAGVVKTSGVAANGTAVAKFTTASGVTPAQVKMAVIKAEGFNAGEFVTVTLDFTGDAPKASDFTIAGTPSIVDVNGVAINGLTIQFN